MLIECELLFAVNCEVPFLRKRGKLLSLNVWLFWESLLSRSRFRSFSILRSVILEAWNSHFKHLFLRGRAEGARRIGGLRAPPAARKVL